MPPQTLRTDAEQARFHTLTEPLTTLEDWPVPRAERLQQLGLFLSRQSLTHLLWLDHLYRQIATLPGIILDCGCRYGSTAATLLNLRGIFEPHNYARRVVAFDLFPTQGQWAMPEGYAAWLQDVLREHDQASPVAHIAKSEVIAGDIAQTLPAYLTAHPETLIALAFADFGSERETAAVVDALLPHLVPGGILAVNPLSSPHWPGATVALRQALARSGRRLGYFFHWPLGGDLSWVRLES